MTEEERVSPEILLAAISKEEEAKGKGHLKIYLGMAAGVGKTYAMLEDAHERIKEGRDLVIGFVDTHGRAETGELLIGLEIVPQRRITYRDITFLEMDLEAILLRQPDIVLVDELAHTNIPGSTHAKRWEDVLEILDHGIDVYTTMNVQHIESLNDVIEQVTDTSVKETVPDSIIEKASAIQLVDLTPEKLLERLREGKVYLGNQSRIAAEHFFHKDRLTALREIVLRYTAERVDRDLHRMVYDQEPAKFLKPREKLLVAITFTPHALKLIRATRRLAVSLDAPWIALHIDTGKVLDEEMNNQLVKNLALARELGAEVITTHGLNVAEAILRIAYQKGVTQVILGRSRHLAFLDYFRSTTLQQLLVKGGDLDIHVIRQEKHVRRYKRGLRSYAQKSTYLGYLLSFLWMCVLTGVNVALLPMIGYRAAGVVFLVGILASSLFLRKGPIFLATVVFALIWYFLFIPNKEARDYEDIALIVLFFMTAAITGVLVDRARRTKEILEKKEAYSQGLYDIVRSIVRQRRIEEVFQTVKLSLKRFFDGEFGFIARDFTPDSPLKGDIGMIFDEKERNAAYLVLENGKETGWSTSTLPSVKNLYIPLRGYQGIVGMMIYHPKVNRFLTGEEKGFLYMIAQEVAHDIERKLLEKKHEVKAYKDIVESISEGISHPLGSLQEAIFGVVQELGQKEAEELPKTLAGQIHKVEDSSKRLAFVFDNVFAMVKLRDMMNLLIKTKCNLEEIVEKSCKDLSRLIEDRKLSFNFASNLPMVFADVHMLEVLIQNLMQKAIILSPPRSTIVFYGSQEEEGTVLLTISFRTSSPYLPPEGGDVDLVVASKIAEAHYGRMTIDTSNPQLVKFLIYIPTRGAEK